MRVSTLFVGLFWVGDSQKVLKQSGGICVSQTLRRPGYCEKTRDSKCGSRYAIIHEEGSKNTPWGGERIEWGPEYLLD